jgi:hypothetical protein
MAAIKINKGRYHHISVLIEMQYDWVILHEWGVILWWPIDDCHSEDFCSKIELITDVESDTLGANFGEQRW